MFPVGGLESLTGGDTGDEPYKGKHGQKRWQKMRENVIREWEAEQASKAGSKQDTKSAGSNKGGRVVVEQDVHEPRDEGHDMVNGNDGRSTAGGKVQVGKEEMSTKVASSKLHMLKAKLFKH